MTPLALPTYITNVHIFQHTPAIDVPNILGTMSESFKTYMNDSNTALLTHYNTVVIPDVEAFKTGILADISQFAVSATSYSTADINSIISGGASSTYTLDAQGRIATVVDGVVATTGIVYDSEDRITDYIVTVTKNSISTSTAYTIAYDVNEIPTITIALIT